jgi:hypothetical protein
LEFVIPGRAKREPGISQCLADEQLGIPGSRKSAPRNDSAN